MMTTKRGSDYAQQDAKTSRDGATFTVSIYYDDVLERDDGQSGNCDTDHAHVHECVRAAAEFAVSHHEQKAVCDDYDYSVQTAVCDASDKHGDGRESRTPTQRST